MKHSDTIDDLLEQYRNLLGKDHNRYRNHVYRVYLNCLLIDTDHDNKEKYAIAAVFHDIGIWTRNTVDYLDPSVKEATDYLARVERSEWAEEISMMIYWHHKLSKYSGRYSHTTGTFRKADWIDVSMGVIKFGVDGSAIRINRKMFGNDGFHWFLLKKLCRNFLQHPLRPLPMFRR